jgi:hypothetical protein
MPRPPLPVRRATAVALALALLAVTLSACLTRSTGPREWTLEATRTDGSKYTVVVRDTSGRIEDAAIDPVGVRPPASVENPPGRDTVVDVPWTGGSCDTRTDITIAAAGPGLTVTIATAVAPGPCDLVGVPHVVRLTGNQAIPAATVAVTMQQAR